MHLFNILRSTQGVYVPPDPVDPFLGYTLLSSILPSMSAGQSLALGSGSKLLVDVAMQDSDRIGPMTVASGAFVRFKPDLDTRLLCDGVDNYGNFQSTDATGVSGTVFPKNLTIDLCGPIPTASGNPGGGPLIRGKTHTGDTPTGNNGTTNDNGGLSRGIINNPGGIMRLTGQVGPQARRLNAHYASGTTLILDAPVTAKAGAKVLVSPTGFYNSGARTEVRTLAADVNNSTTITINTALGYARWGVLQYATDSGISTSPGTFSTMRAHANQNPVIDQRAFVCIMDRSIKIRGYDAGNTSLASYGFGMHGMSMGLTSETVLTNVEFDNYGQLGLLGRYGWHVHLPSWNAATGAARTDGVSGTNVYPTGKSVFDSCTFVAGFNRAFTFHGCKGVKATNCMSHDSAGHSFFFEDGSEENNESSYNVALAPRDPGSSYRLKAHDDTPSGHWFANLNNTLLENWGIDCPGHGWWNASSKGLSTRASDQYGCLGSSALVAVAPFYAKPGTWTGNSAMSNNGSGGITQFAPSDNEGNLADQKSQTTSNGVAGADYGNPNQVETLLTGARLFKNNDGGYRNRISFPHYDLWVCADNKQAHLQGAVDDGTCTKAIVVRESLNHESHALDTGNQQAFASYHDLLDFQDVSAFGYSGGSPSRSQNYSLLMKNAVFQTWDLYTDSIQAPSIDDTNWKLYNSLGAYQTAPPCLMNDTTIWNSAYGGQFYEDNPNNPGTPPPSTEHYRWSLGVLYDRWGYLTTGPASAGVAQSFIVFNHPFYTTGITSTAMPEHSTSVYTPTPFFGINVQYDETYALDPYQNFQAACTFYRVDSSRADISGASFAMRDSYAGSYPPGASNSSFFNNMKHCAVPKDAMVRFRHTAQGSTPNSTKFGALIQRVAQADNPANSTTDAFIFGIDWSGSVVPVVNFNGQTFTQVAGNTWAALMATSSGYNYWRDTSANMLWIKVRFASNTAGTNNFSQATSLLTVTN